jgi:hypothetical protein
MNNDNTKNGKAGVFKRTNEPKFEILKPTENEKNNENIIINITIDC